MSDYQPFTIDMLDGVFILDGNRVMAPSLNATPWNETYDALREVYQIREESVIKFVKVQIISLMTSISLKISQKRSLKDHFISSNKDNNTIKLIICKINE